MNRPFTLAFPLRPSTPVSRLLAPLGFLTLTGFLPRPRPASYLSFCILSSLRRKSLKRTQAGE